MKVYIITFPAPRDYPQFSKLLESLIVIAETADDAVQEARIWLTFRGNEFTYSAEGWEIELLSKTVNTTAVIDHNYRYS